MMLDTMIQKAMRAGYAVFRQAGMRFFVKFVPGTQKIKFGVARFNNGSFVDLGKRSLGVVRYHSCLEAARVLGIA